MTISNELGGSEKNRLFQPWNKRFFSTVKQTVRFYGKLYMESHKWKSQNRSLPLVTLLAKYSNVVLILLKAKQLIMGGFLFNSKFKENIEFG